MEKKEKKESLKERKKIFSMDNKKFIIIGIILLLLLIIGIIYWFLNRRFDIILDYNDLETEEILKVKYNNKINKDDVKDKDDLGEKFIGWFLVIENSKGKEELAKEPFDFNEKIKKDIKLRAVYSGDAEKITITFNTDGGSEILPLEIMKGAKLEFPSNPTKENCDFDKWVTSDGLEVANNTIFNESATLTAVWKKQQVTISFDSNGGSNVNSITIDKGSALAFPANPTKEFHNFTGWTKDGKNVANNSVFSKNATLKATWEKRTPKIELYVDHEIIGYKGYSAKITYKVIDSNSKVKLQRVCSGNHCIAATLDENTNTIVAEYRTMNLMADFGVMASLIDNPEITATKMIKVEPVLKVRLAGKTTKTLDHDNSNNLTVEGDDSQYVKGSPYDIYNFSDLTWSAQCSSSAISLPKNAVVVNGKIATILSYCYSDTASSSMNVTVSSRGGQKLTATLYKQVN